MVDPEVARCLGGPPWDAVGTLSIRASGRVARIPVISPAAPPRAPSAAWRLSLAHGFVAEGSGGEPIVVEAGGRAWLRIEVRGPMEHELSVTELSRLEVRVLGADAQPVVAPLGLSARAGATCIALPPARYEARVEERTDHGTLVRGQASFDAPSGRTTKVVVPLRFE